MVHSSDECDADDGGGGRQGCLDYGAVFDKAYAALKAMYKEPDRRSSLAYVRERPAKFSLDVISYLLPLNAAPLYAELTDSRMHGLVLLVVFASLYKPALRRHGIITPINKVALKRHGKHKRYGVGWEG